MTEINNNIPKYSYNVGKTEKAPVKEQKTAENVKQQNDKENDIRDTGVLGRSQIINTKGSDISKSVDEAVNLAINNPVTIEAGDKIFDLFYDKLIAQGFSPTEAYINAASAVSEFSETARAYE